MGKAVFAIQPPRAVRQTLTPQPGRAGCAKGGPSSAGGAAPHSSFVSLGPEQPVPACRVWGASLKGYLHSVSGTLKPHSINAYPL